MTTRQATRPRTRREPTGVCPVCGLRTKLRKRTAPNGARTVGRHRVPARPLPPPERPGRPHCSGDGLPEMTLLPPLGPERIVVMEGAEAAAFHRHLGHALARHRRKRYRTLNAVIVETGQIHGTLKEHEAGATGVSVRKFIEHCAAIGAYAPDVLHEALDAAGREAGERGGGAR